MGRWSGGGKGTLEAAKRVELPWLRKQGCFPQGGGTSNRHIHWSMNGEPTGNISVHLDTWNAPYSIEFTYRIRPHGEAEWRDMSFKFPLGRLPCRFGGFKWFVRCGLYRGGVYCGRRARVLYQAGHYFGCRHCADLTYDSCNESKFFKYHPIGRIFKAEEVEEKLKRWFYRGKPTRKYRRYLKLMGD